MTTEIKELLKLAIPLVSAQLAQSATGFADTVMMGRIGQDTLAAGGLASLTFFALLTTISGVVMGVSPLVAQAFGAGQKRKIEQVVRHGLWLSLILSLPMMILLSHFDTWMSQLGQSPQTVQLANTYLDIMLWGLFPAVGFAMLRGFVSGVSQARPILFIVVGGTLFNVVGNYALGLGKFGFPRLEIAGLAWASIVSIWGMFLALVVYILKQDHLKIYQIFRGFHLVKPPIIKELLWIGVPIGVFSALEVGLFTVVTYLMGRIGTSVLAAHQIVLQTIIIIFMVPLGLSFATTVRVGQWLGQQNLKGAKQAGLVSMGIGIAFMLLTSFVLLLFPKQVVSIYLNIDDPANAEVLRQAISMLSIAAIAQTFDGLQKTAYGALQGLQDTRVPMLLSFPIYWGIGLLSGYLLAFELDLGGVGLWLGQSIGIFIAAIVLMGRFLQISDRPLNVN